MLFMLLMSFELLPLVLLAPPFWLALLVLLAVGALSPSRSAGAVVAPLKLIDGRWPPQLVALILIPLFLIGWGLYFWPPPGIPHWPHEALLLGVVTAVAAAEVFLAAWLLWRQRQRHRPTLVGVILITWWTFGAAFAASMAISDTWL